MQRTMDERWMADVPLLCLLLFGVLRRRRRLVLLLHYREMKVSGDVALTATSAALSSPVRLQSLI